MSALLFQGDILFYQRLLRCCGYYNDALDGIWGPNTDAADSRFNADAEALKVRLGQFDARTEGNILTLHIKTQERARKFMTETSGGPFSCRIISGTRSYKQQNELYAKGRFGNPGSKVTNARGGQSNHNFCIAWDVGLFDRSGRYLTGASEAEVKAYNDVAASVDLTGLEWGGNWKNFIDRPHYQLKTERRTSEVRDLFEAGQPYV